MSKSMKDLLIPFKVPTEAAIVSRDCPEVSLIPTPREISISCGVSCRFARDDLKKVMAVCNEHGIVPAQLYQVSEGGTRWTPCGLR